MLSTSWILILCLACPCLTLDIWSGSSCSGHDYQFWQFWPISVGFGWYIILVSLKLIYIVQMYLWSVHMSFMICPMSLQMSKCLHMKTLWAVKALSSTNINSPTALWLFDVEEICLWVALHLYYRIPKPKKGFLEAGAGCRGYLGTPTPTHPIHPWP